MTSRREVLRFASLATAAGCAPFFARDAFAFNRGQTESLLNSHTFHAEATVLRPCTGVVSPEAFAILDSRGGLLSRSVAGLASDRSVSFRSGYITVSGGFEEGSGKGWVTSSTAVVEGLDIADVMTADRIVSRISTLHPRDGYVPSVSFQGSAFENLRIAGRPVELDLDLPMLGKKPAADVPYLSHGEFRQRVQTQQARLALHPSSAVASRYGVAPAEDGEQIEFSLIHGFHGDLAQRSFGNVVHVPGFGDVLLGMVKLSQKDYRGATARATTIELTMVQTQTQPASGSGNGGGTSTPVAITNGGSGT